MVLKCRDAYIENTRMVSLVLGLKNICKMEGKGVLKWKSLNCKVYCTNIIIKKVVADATCQPVTYYMHVFFELLLGKHCRSRMLWLVSLLTLFNIFKAKEDKSLVWYMIVFGYFLPTCTCNCFNLHPTRMAPSYCTVMYLPFAVVYLSYILSCLIHGHPSLHCLRWKWLER